MGLCVVLDAAASINVFDFKTLLWSFFSVAKNTITRIMEFSHYRWIYPKFRLSFPKVYGHIRRNFAVII